MRSPTEQSKRKEIFERKIQGGKSETPVLRSTSEVQWKYKGVGREYGGVRESRFFPLGKSTDQDPTNKIFPRCSLSILSLKYIIFFSIFR